MSEWQVQPAQARKERQANKKPAWRVASAACFQEVQEAGLLVTGARFQQMLRFWDWA